MAHNNHISQEYTTGGVILCRLKHGDDLLEALTALCRDREIAAGTVQGIGALSRAAAGYYDQKDRVYRDIGLPGHWEILSLLGNISLRDGAPMCHAHIILGNERGETFGGHLTKGCTVFACECAITVLNGTPLNRAHDETTGLPLWSVTDDNRRKP